MSILLISENDEVSRGIRLILNREGLECPASNVVALDDATAWLSKTPAELILVVMPHDPERAIAALELLRNLPNRSMVTVLAIGPTADPKMVLRSLRGAVDDYLDESDIDTELTAALARWQSEHTINVEEGRLIAVLAPSGGSGSSTLAANVATVLAKEHHTSLVIDMKLETGDLAALLDLKPVYTLADLCQNVTRLDRTLFQHSLAQHESGVSLLAPPRMLSDVGRVTADGIRQALRLARSTFPYVVVDLDHSFREEQAQVLRQADVVLLVMRLDFPSLRNTRRTLDYLEQQGISREKVRVVVNRYGQPKEVPASKAEEALGVKIFHYVPDEPKTINRANNNGVPVVLESPSAKVSKSVTQLAVNVNGRHKSH